MILLIDNYDSFTYNLVHYLGELGATCDVVRNDKLTVDEALGKKPTAIVLSPGPCTPAEAGICVDLVTSTAGRIPILGVCLGHQAIGAAYGGDVIRAKKPMHGKVDRIRNTGAGVFAGLPSTVEVTRYHSLTVDPDTLPDSFEITATATDGMIMGLQHKSDPVHGVQFHPESIKTDGGHDMLANFLTIAGITPRRRNKAA
ncbi:MAG: aminodeoxychorismate/anthranilate synthase component II [Pseudomonadota bacterium]